MAKVSIYRPNLTSGLRAGDTLVLPYSAGDSQANFDTALGINVLFLNGGVGTLRSVGLVMLDDTDTFTVAFNPSDITITWRAEARSIGDTDDVIFAFNLFSGYATADYVDAEIAALSSIYLTIANAALTYTPKSTQVLAGTGLTGGGALSADVTVSLGAAAIASLGLADSAVQPTRAVNAGTGLTGGGDLSANRTLALDAPTQTSLNKADTALQPGEAQGYFGPVDTTTTPPTNGDGLVFDGTNWVPGPAGGGMFKGENGTVGSRAGDIFRINAQTLNTSVTIDASENASAAGPLTIATGVTLTVTSGGNLSIV